VRLGRALGFFDDHGTRLDTGGFRLKEALDGRGDAGFALVALILSVVGCRPRLFATWTRLGSQRTPAESHSLNRGD
jgi:hypothetical protein